MPSIELLFEMYAEGERMFNERICEYCGRILKSKRGKNIHRYYCKARKLQLILDDVRKQIPVLVFTTPNKYCIDNRIRTMNL